jgi:hypothetical protein
MLKVPEALANKELTETCRLGDVINKWRATLDLEPIAMVQGPSLAESLKIPFTYCWSPALVPKPKDWPAHIGKVSSER